MDTPTVSFRLNADASEGIRIIGARLDDTGTSRASSVALSPALSRVLRIVLLAVAIVTACAGMGTAGVRQLAAPVPAPDGPDPMSVAYHTCIEQWDWPIDPPTPVPLDVSMGTAGAYPTDSIWPIYHSSFGYAIWRDPYGAVGSQSGMATPMPYDASIVFSPQDLENNALMHVAFDTLTGPVFIIDGVDHSQEYIQCLNVSGYIMAAKLDADRQKAALKELILSFDDTVLAQAQAQTDQQVQANNQWAACARRNGWMVRDTSAPTDDSYEVPDVTLPSYITPSQLATLLDTCPAYDAVQADEAATRYSDYYDGIVMYDPPDYAPPSIAIRLEPPSATPYPLPIPSALDSGYLSKLAALYIVLDAQRNAYYAQQIGEQISAEADAQTSSTDDTETNGQ